MTQENYNKATPIVSKLNEVRMLLLRLQLGHITINLKAEQIRDFQKLEHPIIGSDTYQYPKKDVKILEEAVKDLLEKRQKQLEKELADIK